MSSLLSVQPSLFGTTPPGETGVRAAGPLAGQLHRVQLDECCWVDLLPGWLDPNDRLFERLLRRVPWRAERRVMYDRIVDVPRLVSFYRDGVRLPDPVLTSVRARLSEHYLPELGEPFATAGFCLYRDGADSVAWHGDRIGRGAYEDTMVAIISLGAVRSLALRPVGGGCSRRFDVGHGDLLVMGGACQRHWEHAVPKTAKACGPRISVQFRVRGVA